jgi:hypothetical protein
VPSLEASSLETPFGFSIFVGPLPMTASLSDGFSFEWQVQRVLASSRLWWLLSYWWT